jgi:general secretion pathway protein F/type IV pilus assembly protein PilC
MPTFAYKARNRSGEPVNGTVMADSTAAVARILDERALLPVQVDEVQTQQRSLLTGRARKVGASKVGVTYEQLADLLRAGVPMLRALDVLGKQAASPALVRVLREVRDDVAGGDALADAMEKHPHAFPGLHASMVRAGEKGGFVEDVLARLSEFVSRQDALRNKFIGALIYPLVLLLGTIGAVTFIMTFVVPKIRQVLSGQDLPLPTIIVFAVSDALQHHWMVVIGVIVTLIVMIAGYFKSAHGKLMLARLQLRIIGLGKIYTMIAVCRFCRIFGTLLGNGIPMLQALKIAKDSTGNVILIDAIDAAAENVRQGESLAGPLASSKLFPPAIVDMIAVAEESNTLEKVLVEVANTQEERTARQIDFTMRLLEPLMLVFMGTMIAFIAIALLVPILRMAASGFKG